MCKNEIKIIYLWSSNATTKIIQIGPAISKIENKTGQLDKWTDRQTNTDGHTDSVK